MNTDVDYWVIGLFRDRERLRKQLVQGPWPETETPMSTMEAPRPTPSLGRIVHYTLSDYNAEYVNEIRQTTGRGNKVEPGDRFPMIIVRVHSNDPSDVGPDTHVNGQVFLDGTDVLWVTSVGVGDGPGHFTWPERV